MQLEGVIGTAAATSRKSTIVGGFLYCKLVFALTSFVRVNIVFVGLVDKKVEKTVEKRW